jgi:hypothetical protein
MTGITDARRAVEIERILGEYLRLRWDNVITLMIKEGYYTANEMFRVLGMDKAQMRKLCSGLNNNRCLGNIKKRGSREDARYELNTTRTQ